MGFAPSDIINLWGAGNVLAELNGVLCTEPIWHQQLNPGSVGMHPRTQSCISYLDFMNVRLIRVFRNGSKKNNDENTCPVL